MKFRLIYFASKYFHSCKTHHSSKRVKIKRTINLNLHNCCLVTPHYFFSFFHVYFFFYFTELYCPRQRCSNILLASRFLGTGCTGPTGTETQFSKRINSMASTPRSLPTLLWYVLGLVLLKYGSEEKGSSLCKCSTLLGFFLSKN